MKFPQPTLLPYFTAGWPSREGFLAAVRGAARAGCPAFEVGIPFTDPMADGPVIQRTSQAALEAGIDFGAALKLTAEAVRQSGLPAIAMTYCNLVYSRGLEDSFGSLAEAGVKGLILPDLSLEEGEPFEAAARKSGLDLIYLCAPTTPDQRISLLAERTSGFLYLVSLRGVTGERKELSSDLEDLLRRVRARCNKPILVGFGVSRPDQAAFISQRCHGVVVGSALLSRIDEMDPDAIEVGVQTYLGELLGAMKSSGTATAAQVAPLTE